MFTWSYEDLIEIDLPLRKAWDFYMDPVNWLKWEDRFDSFVHEGTLRTGSQIQAKIKNKPHHVVILVPEVKPYQECKSLVRMLFFTQESLYAFEEISPEKTRIILKISIISFFTPFMKKFFLKNMEKIRPKYLSALAELAASQ